MESKPVIYTIGHSTHRLEYFLELLEEYKVTCIIDVRSVAASSYNPQYNQEPFKKFLKSNGIAYLHFAEEFGARHSDPDLLDNVGKVDFIKVRRTWAFKNGVERIWQGLNKGFVISLMCSEGEPLDCHRFSMVSIALDNDGFDVQHILKDKTIKTNAQLEEELLKKYSKKLPKPDMFNPDITIEDQINAAYRLKNEEIGFSPFPENKQEQSYD